MRLIVAGALALGVFCYSGASAAENSYTPTTLTAQQIFEKASAVRGGVSSKGTFRRVYSLNSGNGTQGQRELVESDGDYRDTIHEGAFAFANGSYHGKEWTQNANGTVTVDSGFHESDNPYARAIRTVEIADPRVTVLGITASQPAMIVVEIHPGAKLLERRFYDAKTYLLRRVEHKSYDGSSTVATYDDFTTKYGLTLAQSLTFDDGHPDNVTHAHLDSFERISPAQTALPIPASRPLFDLGGRETLQIPADFTAEGIIVRLNVGGRGLDFQLDSGASSMVIDSNVARSLGLPLTDVHTESMVGDFKVSRTRIPSLSLGDIQAHDVAMEAIPWNRLVGTRKVVGLLGGDFFASARINVNFKDSTLWMQAPAKAAPAAPWSPVSIELDDLVPRAHAKFNGVDGAFIVDLGADYTMLYGHYFSHFNPTGKAEVLGQVEGIALKPIDYKQYRFSRFDLGDLAFEGGSALVPEGSSWEDEDYDGLLGRNILSSFNLLFDYANQRLYVAP